MTKGLIYRLAERDRRSAIKGFRRFPFKKIKEGKVLCRMLDFLIYPLLNVENETIFIYAILYINQN